MDAKSNKDDCLLNVCEHVAEKTHPILVLDMLVSYNNPVFTGWIASCNPEIECNEDNFKEWTVKELLNYEPTLKEFLDDFKKHPLIERKDVNSPWESVHPFGPKNVSRFMDIN